LNLHLRRTGEDQLQNGAHPLCYLHHRSQKDKVRGLKEALPASASPEAMRAFTCALRSACARTNVGFHLAGYRYNPKRQDDSAKGHGYQLRSFKPFWGSVTLILRRSKKPYGGTRWADVLFLNLLGVAKAYSTIPQSQAVLGYSPEFAR
jgi:hypothetical protein